MNKEKDGTKYTNGSVKLHMKKGVTPMKHLEQHKMKKE